MKKTLLLLLFFCFLCTSGFAQLSWHYQNLLDTEFKKRVELLNLKGAAAAIVFPDSSVWASAVGKYGKNDLNTDLLYEIGSNTKTMVAATILLLEEEGLLSLEDTIYKYLSPIENISYGITIRQLLNHTSGLFNYTDHPNFGSYINTNWDKDIPLQYVLDNFVSAPTQSPGGEWSYCNTNYFLLGMIIEEVTGKKLAEVFRERLFTPLNLNNSYLAAKETYTKTHLGTWLNNGAYLEEPATAFMTSAWAAGAVISTPQDLAMWAFHLYSGNLLSASSFDKMNTVIDLTSTQSYGLGMFLEKYKGKAYLGHGGTTLQNSEMQYSVASDFSVATIVIEQGKATQARLVQKRLIDIMETEIKKLGVSKIEVASLVEMHPNPSFGSVLITNKKSKKLSLQVYNSNGQLVVSLPESAYDFLLHKEDLGTGLFVVKITNSENGAQYNQKLIIN